MLSVAGMPPEGSNELMNPWTSARISSSGGRNDHALVSMRINERTRSGRASDDSQDDTSAHGMAQEVDRPLPQSVEEPRQVGDELVDGVALEMAGLRRVAVTPLVERDHAAVGRQCVDLEREVVR